MEKSIEQGVNETLRSKQLEYWKNKNLLINPVCPFLDIFRKSVSGKCLPPDYRRQDILIEGAVASAVLKVCNDSDISLYILLQTLTKCLMARYQQDAQVTLLSPLYKVDPAACIVDFSVMQDKVFLFGSVKENILETRKTVIGAYSNQEYFLGDTPGLSDLTDIAGRLRQNVVCTLSNIHGQPEWPHERQFAVRFTRTGDQLEGVIDFDANTYDVTLVKCFAAVLGHFMEIASRDFNQVVESIPLLPAGDRERILQMGKGGQATVPECPLHELLSLQAARTPDNTALIHRDEQLSYARLDALSNSGAATLMAKGIKSGDKVLLYFSRSVEMVTAIFAVLKAGAAFVPVSIEEPADRVRLIVKDVQPALILTNVTDLPFDGRIPILDSLAGGVDEPELLRPAVSPDSPAYVIFTSGTTGHPKGVVISHRAIVNATHWRANTYEFSAASVSLLLFAYNFDGFILNLCSPLAGGGQVVLVDDHQARAPQLIAAVVKHQQVTHITLTPPLYHAILEAALPGVLDSLSCITLAGDITEAATLQLSKSIVTHVRVCNEYGPTENAVVSTFKPDMASESVRVIGMPVSNVTVKILGQRRDLLPVGVFGELCLAGMGLSSGYLNNQQLTDEAFVTVDHERVYLTGDLARWLPDGTLEFRGRKNDQVKLRGYRIELNEIRQVLFDHPAVSDAVVIIAGEGQSAYLCACIRPAREVTAGELQQFASQKLPYYMVPQQFVMFDALPLTEIGKYDTGRLRGMVADNVSSAAEELPGGSVEQQLLEIWKNVLKTDQIGINQNFFALGGHSLKATRLLSEIHHVFKVDLLLNQIFVTSTIKELAVVITEALGNDTTHIPPVASQELYAASAAQQRMLLLKEMRLPEMAYNIPVLFRFATAPEPVRLEKSLKALQERHEVLRTTFEVSEGKTVMRIITDAPLPFRLHTLPEDADPVAFCQSLLLPFDPEMLPLFRVNMIHIADGGALLLFDFHHIIVDERALAVFFEELMQLYSGVTPEPLTKTYKDYAAWQQTNTGLPEYAAQLDYWKDKFSTVTHDFIDLPFDFPGAPRTTVFCGDRVMKKIDPHTFARIGSFCREEECTHFMFLTAVFSILLQKLAGHDEIVIGTPVSERMHPETRDMVGLFLNTIPLLIKPDRNDTFRVFLRKVKQDLLSDLQHAAVQFGDIVKVLHSARTPGKHPLFNVMLAVVDSDVVNLQLDDRQAETVPLHNQTSKFDLSLEVHTGDEGMMIEMEYSTGLFTRTSIERISGHLMVLLDDLLQRPDGAIGEAEMLTANDKHALLAFANSNYIYTVSEETVLTMFERQVAQGPDRPAVIFGDEQLTYAELNERANHLAAGIRHYISPGQYVALLLDRSCYTIISILAVQKAGGVYVPIETSYPDNRIARIITGSGAVLLVTDQNELPESCRQLTAIDVRHPEVVSHDTTGEAHAVTADDTLYVLYTSGTTGAPKGVMITHRNIVNLVSKVTPYIDAGASDTWTLFHTYCFDAAAWEMYAALLTGAKLVIVPVNVAKDPGSLCTLIDMHGVTMLCQPPSAFYNLVEEMTATERPTTLRAVILGGEAVKLYKLKNWYDRYGAVKVINGYGITETTVYSSYKIITANEVAQSITSIGRPLPSNYMYILDSNRKLCPQGVLGEIYVGGMAVGMGYLGNPEMTSDRFLDDPYRQGGKLYKTGDLARWKANGEIDYYSRADDQVKIRGYRVEIAEIEIVLATYPGIKDVVLTTLDHEASGLQLVAYFTADTDLDAVQLRAHVEKHLPHFMVPAFFTRLEAIPFSTNGKIDRSKLPDPKTIYSKTVMVNATTTPTEALLKDIWADILGLPADQIGVDDKFFFIGGDSISAHLVVRRLNSLNIEASLVDLFECDTIRTFGEHLDAQQTPQRPAAPAATDILAGWHQMTEAETEPLPRKQMVDWVAAQETNGITFNFPAKPVLAIENRQDAIITVPQLVLTAYGSALQMWTGENRFHVTVVDAGGLSRTGTAGSEHSNKIFPVALVMEEINDLKLSLANVSTRLKEGVGSALDMAVLADTPELFDLLKNDISFVANSKEEEIAVLQPLQYVLSNAVNLNFHVTADELQFHLRYPRAAFSEKVMKQVSENLKFCLHQLVDQLNRIEAAPQQYDDRLVYEVESFNDVFFRNCAYQSHLTALKFFGRQYKMMVANTIPIYQREEAARNVKFRNGYLTERTDEELNKLLGVQVINYNDSQDICGDLMHHLSQGSLATVHIDCFHVPVKRELYQKKHGGHVMLVLGYDRVTEEFHIIDNQASVSTNYQRNTISFSVLRTAYAGYNEFFNPHRNATTISVLTPVQRTQSPVTEKDVREAAVRYLKKESAALGESKRTLDFIYNTLRFILSDTPTTADSIVQLNSVFGEFVNAKKIELYKAEHLLQDEQLVTVLTAIVQHLEYVRNVLTKMELSRNFAQGSVAPLLEKITLLMALEEDYLQCVDQLM